MSVRKWDSHRTASWGALMSSHIKNEDCHHILETYDFNIYTIKHMVKLNHKNMESKQKKQKQKITDKYQKQTSSDFWSASVRMQ